MKTLGQTIAALLIVGGLVFGAWKYLSAPVEAKKVRDTVIALDPSDSLLADADGRIFYGLIDRAVRRPGLDGDSSVTIVIGGDEATDFEPVSLPSFAIPFSERIMEGKDVVERQRREAVKSAVKAVVEATRETRSSPIRRMIQRALEQLRARGCTAGSGCEIHVRSDGEETESPWLRDSLKAGRVLKADQPPALDNSIAIIRWCGISETRGDAPRKAGKRKAKRAGANPDLVQALWRLSFSNPETVIFEPFCPKAGE